MDKNLEILKKSFIDIWGDVLKEDLKNLKEWNITGDQVIRANENFLRVWTEVWEEFINNTDLIDEELKDQYRNNRRIGINFVELV